jgi:hypothetical protein
MRSGKALRIVLSAFSKESCKKNGTVRENNSRLTPLLRYR